MNFQGIPTLIIAISGIDDATSVAVYGIIKSIMFSHDALWYQILQGPIAVIGGLGFGIMWGWLAKYVPEKGDVSTFSLFGKLNRALEITIVNYIFAFYRTCECIGKYMNKFTREKYYFSYLSHTWIDVTQRGVHTMCADVF